jgi:hypothetical protein
MESETFRRFVIDTNSRYLLQLTKEELNQA